MLIFDMLMLAASFMTAGNEVGKVFRKEKDYRTAIWAGVLFLFGIYFTLALIGAAASLAIANP